MEGCVSDVENKGVDQCRRRSRYREAAFAVCAVSIASVCVFCSNLRGSQRVIDESKGQWVFVPKSGGSHVSPEGLTYPDENQDANDIFPNDFKTYTSKGTWVYLSNPAVEIPKLNEPKIQQGINWGTLDCGFHGPKYESRALGCDRPGRAFDRFRLRELFLIFELSPTAGGCGAKPVVKRSNALAECGSNSHFCISALKKCLVSKGATGTSKPSYGKLSTRKPPHAAASS